MSFKKILVIGDGCIDFFSYCQCTRLSPEVAVPVLDIVRTTSNIGMAGNVHRNILSIYPECSLLMNDNYDKVTKTRYVEEKTNHMFIRIDSNEKIKRISFENLKAFSSYDAIVISDYNKGFLTEDDIKYITENHPLTFIDTKKILGPWIKNASFIKINRKEYQDSEKEIKKYNLKNKIIQTLGSDGCEFQGKKYPVKKVEIKDLSGAGDSFLAGFVVKYIETKDIDKSLSFANEAATIVVQKMGVSVIKEE